MVDDVEISYSEREENALSSENLRQFRVLLWDHFYCHEMRYIFRLPQFAEEKYASFTMTKDSLNSHSLNPASLSSESKSRTIVLNHVFVGDSANVSLFFTALGILISIAYTVQHLLYGNEWVGAFSALSAISLMIVSHHIIKKTAVGASIVAFFLFMSCALIVTSYHHGIRGLILNFALIATYFYCLRFSYALGFSITLVSACLIAATNYHDTLFIVRVFVAFLAALAFFAAFSYRVEQQRERLIFDADYDELTKIFNRRGFAKWLELQLMQRQTKEADQLVLFFIDLDDFKRINDTRGHLVGDQLLKECGARLSKFLESNPRCKTGAVARIAGDEFALGFVQSSRNPSAEILAEKLLEVMRTTIPLPSVNVTVNMSIGIEVAFFGSEQVGDLMRNADAALNWAKKKGKNRYQIFNDEIADDLNHRAKIERSLHESLESNAFELVYMPIIDLDTRRLIAAEVLLRSKHPALAGYPTEEFIRVAEGRGMITKIDLWVVKEVFEFSLWWKKMGYSGIKFTINVSANELISEYFVTELTKLVAVVGVDTSDFALEITETAFIEQEDHAIKCLHHLRSMGFAIALDDFGTGYMGFNQLSAYPVDHIKIDRSFISDIDTNGTGMVDVLLQIARLHGLSVVAEGIETDYHESILRDKGCDYGQGYHIQKPMPKEKLIEFYLDNNPKDISLLAQ